MAGRLIPAITSPVNVYYNAPDHATPHQSKGGVQYITWRLSWPGVGGASGDMGQRSDRRLSLRGRHRPLSAQPTHCETVRGVSPGVYQ